MASGSPFRRHSQEKYAPRDPRDRFMGSSFANQNASTIHESAFKERHYATGEHTRYLQERDMNAHLSRSRSPIGGQRFVQEEVRSYQIAERYAPPARQVMVEHRVPHHREITVIKKVSQHQDYFVSELQAEVNELRHRQGDLLALRDQIRHLQECIKDAQMDKQNFENDCLAKITDDRQQVDVLIRELDHLRSENTAVENEQVQLLETINVTEKDNFAAMNELAQLRNEISACDSGNLAVRKDIEHFEHLCHDQKEVNHANYNELTRIRDVAFQIDKENEANHKRCSILRADLDNNDNRIGSMQGICAERDDQLNQVSMRIQEAHAQISEHKYTLNKLDGELGYFESQNEQHKAAQGQLFKANEYEYAHGKDGSMRCQELQIALSKAEQDEKSTAFELDRLKQHSDQMLKDQMDLQAEIDALDKHMANLNNQNYCLQKELEDFVDADEAVKRNLDRKAKVESIRYRVDDCVRRSNIAVVEQRPPPQVVEHVGARVVTETRHVSRSANLAHSPIREVGASRTAYGRFGPPPPDMRATAQPRYDARDGFRSSVSPLRKDDGFDPRRNAGATEFRSRSGNAVAGGKEVRFAGPGEGRR